MANQTGNRRLALAALGLGLLIAIALVETIPRLLPGLMPAKLRAVQRIYDARSSWEGMMRGDRELGFTLLPDLDLDFPSEGRTIEIRTKRLLDLDLGYRDIGTGEPPWQILVLGDSFTFCDDSPAEECWVRRLGERIEASIGTLGVNGYSNLAEARLLEKVAKRLSPKIVLVAFFPNDFKDNLHFRNWTQTGTDDYWQWMRAQRRSDASDALANYSILYRLIDAARRYGNRETYEHKEGGLDFVFRADAWWKTVLEQPGQTPGYKLSEEAFRAMAKTASDADAELVVLLLPFKEQVYWDVARRYTEGGDELELEEIDAPMNAVKTYLASQGIRHCDLTPDLRREAAEGRQLYLRTGAHWNDAGNAATAKAVASCLAAQGLVASAGN